MDQIPMKNQEITMRNAQSGSIFIWIFVMIALFGALSYAMLQGSRGSSSSLTAERAKLAANEIVAFHTQIRNAIKAMRIDGCRDTEISFQSSYWSDASWYNNTTSPGDGKCHLFHPAGGGLNVVDPPESMGFSSPDYWEGKYFFVGETVWAGQATTCADDSCADLIMITINLPKEVCEAINRMAGIDDIPYDASWGGTPFSGVYTYVDDLADLSASASAAAKPFACFEHSDTSYGTPYTFGGLLLAR